MLLASEARFKDIATCLSLIVVYVELTGRKNLTDCNRFLEDLFKDVLNIVYSYNLVNLNTYFDQNYPGVDLGDVAKRFSVQVTSNCTRQKIQDGLNKFQEHNLDKFDQIKFLLISDRKPNRSDTFVTNGKFSFSYDTDVISASELMEDIDDLDTTRNDKLKTLLVKHLEPLKGYIEQENLTIEILLFQKLFRAISEDLKIQANGVIPTLNESSADLQKKRERFKTYWELITTRYRSIFTTTREAFYKKQLESFSEEDQIRVSEYLMLESDKSLFDTKGDPIKAIEMLTSKIISHHKLKLMSETEIQYFLYYELYNCHVFPNLNE